MVLRWGSMIKKKKDKKDSTLDVIARNVADIKYAMANMVTKDYLEERLEEKFNEKLAPLARKADLVDFVTNGEFDRKIAKLATKEDITRLEAKIDGLKITEIVPLKERVTKLERQSRPAHI